MTDQELDQALSAALDVDHAPDFRARVRARVAAEPRSVGWHVRWPFAVAGVGLSAIALVVLIVSWPDGRHWLPGQTPIAVSQWKPPVPPAQSAIQTPTVIHTAANAVLTGRGPLEPGRSTEPRFPEVVISPEDARALRFLVTTIQKGVLPEEMPVGGVSRTDLPALPDIAIPPVAIEPLPQIERLEQGDRPR